MSANAASEVLGGDVNCALIVEAVAEREGVAVTDLRSTLYEAIDTDALESILTSGSPATGPPVMVRFEYAGHTVLAGSDGTLAVE